MFLSLSWLKKHINIPGKISPEKIGSLLISHTAEVEEIKNPADFPRKSLMGSPAAPRIKPIPSASSTPIAVTGVSKTPAIISWIGTMTRTVVASVPATARKISPVSAASLSGSLKPKGLAASPRKCASLLVIPAWFAIICA